MKRAQLQEVVKEAKAGENSLKAQRATMAFSSFSQLIEMAAMSGKTEVVINPNRYGWTYEEVERELKRIYTDLDVTRVKYFPRYEGEEVEHGFKISWA